jgi:hypothetical protein
MPKPNKAPTPTTIVAQKWSKAMGSTMLVVGILSSVTSSPVYADQIGVETEAPTLYTGEIIEVRKNGTFCPETERRLVAVLFCRNDYKSLI